MLWSGLSANHRPLPLPGPPSAALQPHRNYRLLGASERRAAPLVLAPIATCSTLSAHHPLHCHH